MKIRNNKINNQFHAVDFMRQVRGELSKKHLEDKEQYLLDLKTAMESFKRKQQETYTQQEYLK